MTLTNPVANEFSAIAQRIREIREENAKLAKERAEAVAKEEAENTSKAS